jgi:F-type H+-transporting ATPase subunit delta
VIAVYTALLEDRTGKVRVSVQTAAPLPEDQRSRLVSQLRELTKREPLLEEKVDPDLLGGLVVQVGDWRYDASVRHQLEIIRNQLIESSSHEIQTGRDRFSTAEGN